MGRRRGGFHRRLVDTRDIRQRFLIICEGETEKVYFEGFHAPHVVMRVKSGDSDPLRLVVQARDHQRRERDAFDQIWCVFDRDVVPVERFSRALQEAEESAIHIAYSNPAFELWFLLHFETCGALTRQDSIQRLGRWLKRPYKKGDFRLYEALEARQEEAVDRATRLLANYHFRNPTADNPSTTVHLLVQELRRFSRPL